jgi:hypothetical protein
LLVRQRRSFLRPRYLITRPSWQLRSRTYDSPLARVAAVGTGLDSQPFRVHRLFHFLARYQDRCLPDKSTLPPAPSNRRRWPARKPAPLRHATAFFFTR